MNITLPFIDLSVQTTYFVPHFLRQNIFERNKLFFIFIFQLTQLVFFSLSSTGLGDVRMKLRFDYLTSCANKTGENQVHVQSCYTI